MENDKNYTVHSPFKYCVTFCNVRLNKKCYSIKDTVSTALEWELFLKDYYFKKLYLVFAGPYPASPTSSFGHIFILLEPQENRPFLLWQTIDFSATTDGIGSLEFFLKGIFGGLKGEYRTVPFFEKYREYTFIESRPLWLFSFDLTELEKENFLHNVYMLQKKSYPYSFSNKNCASQIDSLLRISLNDKNISESVVFFPHTLINNWENRIGEHIFIESMNNVIYDSYNKLSADLSSDNYDITKLSSAETVLLLNVLEWKYSHENDHLSEDQKEYLKKLRMIVSSSKNNTINNFMNSKKEFNLHPSILVGSGVKLISRNSPEYLMSFRFGLHEFYENTSVYPANDYLSIMKMEIGLNKNKIAVNELLLFNQLSLQPLSLLSNYFSWRIGLGMERKVEYLNSPIVYGLFTGIGYSIQTIENRVNLSLLMDVSPVYINNYGFSVIYGPEIIAQINISNKLKLMNILRVSFNSRNNLDNIFYNETNLGIEVTKLSNIFLQIKYSRNSGWYSIKYNFYIN